jgi:hypothetical protein
VQVGIHGAVVGFLINDQPLGAGLHDGLVLDAFHRADLERNAGHLLAQGAHARGQVIARDKLRVFTRDEQEVAETLGRQRARLAAHLVHGQGHTQDRIVA